MSLCSSSERNENEKYREAWHLLREAAGLHEAESADKSTASTPDAGGFPKNAVERMEAAANFARRFLEGNYPRAQKER